jgi:hypothetical protein
MKRLRFMPEKRPYGRESGVLRKQNHGKRTVMTAHSKQKRLRIQLLAGDYSAQSEKYFLSMGTA